jgi:hypothetical protein
LSVLVLLALPVGLLLAAALVVPLVRGSMRKGPTQLRQEAEAREARERRRAARAEPGAPDS